MFIQRLQVSHVRNLSRISLPQLKPINIFFGANGSGKTSLLEAAHLLLMGRSFRQGQLRPLLQEEQPQCVVFAELSSGEGNSQSLGISRQRDGSKPQIKLNGNALGSLSELVQIAPVQVLSADSFEMLTGGPSNRRQFLDWGLFHVEPNFFPAWRLAQRALKQRNSLIRHGKIDRDQLLLWSREYARYGEQIDQMRQAYLERLLPAVRSVMAELAPAISDRLDMTYSRGWAKDVSLEAALSNAIELDIQQGHTRQGPHRADLRVYAGPNLAGETLSRGQLKALVAGFHLAQAELLRTLIGRKSIFLIDDLAAELDREHRQRFCRQLERLDLQVLATSIEKTELMDCWRQADRIQMFHVEQGQITPETEITTRGIE